MRVYLFVPCYIDQIFPSVASSTMSVLKHLGCDVVFPESQTCCGQPAFNSGYQDEARLIAMHEINAFTKEFRDVPGFDFKRDYIVAPSGSCVAMVRNFYPDLFREDERYARLSSDLAQRVYELSEFIVDIIGVEKFSGRLEATVSYHDSCHALRELGVLDAPRKILSRIAGLKLVELPYNDVCCGFGGTFSVKFPEISASMADEKLDNFSKTGADVMVSGDSSCLMHLQARAERTGVNRKFAHIAEIMADSISGGRS